MAKITDFYHWKPEWVFKNQLTLKSHEWGHLFQVQHFLFGKKLHLKVGNEVKAHWGKEKSWLNPTFTFASRHFSPVQL